MALNYPYPEHPSPGTTMELAEGVRWLSMPMPGSLSHINLYLLEDKNGWYVVDTGLGLDNVAELWHQIFEKELGGKPVIAVICTHMHPDHIGQASLITEHFQCRLYMSRAEYYQARAFFSGTTSGPTHQHSWQAEQFYERAGMPPEYLEEMRASFAARRSEGMSMPDMPMGYERLRDGDTMIIGGRDWRVRVGSGHSPEHVCLYCGSLGILISGDQILPIITSNVSVHPTEPDANPLLDWMDSLDDFLSTPDETLVLPAHNLPFYGVRERLAELMEHHEDRMLAVEEACEEPKTAAELLPVMFARKLDSRQMMMALGEAIAHTHLLMHRNRLKRELGEDGIYRFLSIDPSIARRGRPDKHDAPSDGPMMV